MPVLVVLGLSSVVATVDSAHMVSNSIEFVGDWTLSVH